MRELAEDVGDDRMLDQLASGVQPSAAELVGRFSRSTRVVEGDVVQVWVRRKALHFFDLKTGLAIRHDADPG